jgi:hypothetical protein
MHRTNHLPEKKLAHPSHPTKQKNKNIPIHVDMDIPTHYCLISNQTHPKGFKGKNVVDVLQVATPHHLHNVVKICYSHFNQYIFQ